jgi:hypothetical protein
MTKELKPAIPSVSQPYLHLTCRTLVNLLLQFSSYTCDGKYHLRKQASIPARTSRTHLSVHVGTVHVHLPAVLMNDVADLIDALLIDTMGGRIGHLLNG